MTGQQLAAVAVLVALTALASVAGGLGRARRIAYSLGAFTEEGSTQESWHAAHRIIGGSFLLAALPPAIAAVVVVVAPDGSAGPIAGVGAIAMLPFVVVGISRGLSRIEPRTGSGELVG